MSAGPFFFRLHEPHNLHHEDLRGRRCLKTAAAPLQLLRCVCLTFLDIACLLSFILWTVKCQRLDRFNESESKLLKVG